MVARVLSSRRGALPSSPSSRGGRKASLGAKALFAAVLLVHPAQADEPTPTYPFPEEYVVPKANEVGTTAGQLRIRGLLGGTYGSVLGSRQGAAFAMQSVIEGMLTSAVGLRATSYASIPFDTAPQILAGRFGPSLHFLPYRRLDVGMFFDAGLATLDLFRANRTLLPMLGGGLTLDYSLSSFFALHGELSGQGGIADEGAARVVLLGSALGGIGVMF